MGRARRPLHVALAVAVLLVAVGAGTGCGSSVGSSIGTSAAGVWREVGTPESYLLKIADLGSNQYEVRYRRSFLVPFYAYVKGGKLLIWGENTTSIVWTVTYDRERDRLTATGNLGTFSFTRVRRQ